MKYRIYLDNCCFNRPYDDQSYLVIRLESEAKLFVQKEILQGTFELVWSYMLDFENSVNPYENRKRAIAEWQHIAALDIDYSDEIVELGKKIISKGIKKKDALHIACAIQAKCDYFLTTDKKILNSRFEEIITINPLDFIKILEV
ncbi:MAG: PIN domain-containing protein [Prevotellaceae bacterium]|jgi:predicted nucleic acid-binding protein|nr:PIN domain-containing protein [Prevotellaceae bacterium]